MNGSFSSYVATMASPYTANCAFEDKGDHFAHAQPFDAVQALLAVGNTAEHRLWKSEITIIYWGNA